MNYQACIHFLESTKQYGAKLGLENIQNLLVELNHPQENLKVIHLAGTNGKGSISHIIYNILIASGYTVGLFNSPYILSYKETIQINHFEISEKEFADTADIVKKACTKLVETGKSHPTLFECITAITLLFFFNKKVDFAIIETGLGGKDDATNVFTKPILNVITSIGLDHTEYLGDSIESITYHKAGIIKDNTPVILSQNSTTVHNIIKKICHKHRSPLYATDLINISIKECTKELTEFNLSSPHFKYASLKTKLLGTHQLINIATALTAIHVLSKQFKIKEKAVYEGLYHTTVSSRCEYINKPMPLLLDGAHNVQSMTALTHVLSTYFPNDHITILFGVLGDKDMDEMLHLLSPYASSITLTTPVSPRAASPLELKDLALKYFSEVHIINDPVTAFETITKSNPQNNLVLVTGSLYLTAFIGKYPH